MKLLLLPFLLGALSAQTEPEPAPPPQLPDAVLRQYWHAIAAHHAQVAALEASKTAQQKQMQENIAATYKQIEAIRQQLAASCGNKANLDEAGVEPVCVTKPDPKPAK